MMEREGRGGGGGGGEFDDNILQDISLCRERKSFQIMLFLRLSPCYFSNIHIMYLVDML